LVAPPVGTLALRRVQCGLHRLPIALDQVKLDTGGISPLGAKDGIHFHEAGAKGDRSAFGMRRAKYNVGLDVA
jgi:hypothetical protein